jgi:hypothetical protein
MVNAGYTAGSLSAGLFDWARNIVPKLSPDSIHRLNIDLSAIFALFWRSLKSCPLDATQQPVVDIEAWLKECSMLRMDGNNSSHPTVDSVTVELGGQHFDFPNIELAPPSAVAAINYARYIFPCVSLQYPCKLILFFSHTHREKGQPHRWSAFLTTKREVPHGVIDSNFGADFYNSTLRVLARAAPGTMVWFDPTHWHGTTLPDMEPEDREKVAVQGGISIVTSRRLASVFAKYREQKMSREAALEQAEEAFANDDDESDNEEFGD